MTSERQLQRNAAYFRDLDARTCSRCHQPELITLTTATGERSTVCLTCDMTPVSHRDTAHSRGAGWVRTLDRDTPWVRYSDPS